MQVKLILIYANTNLVKKIFKQVKNSYTTLIFSGAAARNSSQRG